MAKIRLYDDSSQSSNSSESSSGSKIRLFDDERRSKIDQTIAPKPQVKPSIISEPESDRGFMGSLKKLASKVYERGKLNGRSPGSAGKGAFISLAEKIIELEDRGNAPTPDKPTSTAELFLPELAKNLNLSGYAKKIAGGISPYVVPEEDLPAVVENLVGGVETPLTKKEKLMENLQILADTAGLVTGGVAKGVLPGVSRVTKLVPAESILSREVSSFVPEPVRNIASKPIGKAKPTIITPQSKSEPIVSVPENTGSTLQDLKLVDETRFGNDLRNQPTEAQTVAVLDDATNNRITDMEAGAEIGRIFSQEDRQFGPTYTQYSGNIEGAIDHLLTQKKGQVPGAYKRDELGLIDLVYGKTGKDGYGVAHIEELHGRNVVKQIPEILKSGKVRKVGDRAYIDVPGKRAVVRLDWDSKSKTWLVTAFEKSPASKGEITRPVSGISATTNQSEAMVGKNIPPLSRKINVEDRLDEVQLADKAKRQEQAINELESSPIQPKPADALRKAIEEQVEGSTVRYDTAVVERERANDILEGQVDNLKRLIAAEERRKTGFDVTKIKGIDEAAEMLRTARGNPDLTTNDLVEFVKAVPTKSEIDKLKPPRLTKPTPTGEKIVRKPTATGPPKPVGRGKERQSRLYQRNKNTLMAAEGIDEPTYRQYNLDTGVRAATKKANEDLDNLVEMLRGNKPMPKGASYSHYAIAAANEAAERGNFGLQTEMIARLSEVSTAKGQDLVSLRGFGDTPVGVIMEVIKARAKAVGRGKEVGAVIKKEVSKISKELEKAMPKIEDLRSFINGIRC